MLWNTLEWQLENKVNRGVFFSADYYYYYFVCAVDLFGALTGCAFNISFSTAQVSLIAFVQRRRARRTGIPTSQYQQTQMMWKRCCCCCCYISVSSSVVVQIIIIIICHSHRTVKWIWYTETKTFGETARHTCQRLFLATQLHIYRNYLTDEPHSQSIEMHSLFCWPLVRRSTVFGSVRSPIWSRANSHTDTEQQHSSLNAAVYTDPSLAVCVNDRVAAVRFYCEWLNWHFIQLRKYCATG